MLRSKVCQQPRVFNYEKELNAANCDEGERLNEALAPTTFLSIAILVAHLEIHVIIYLPQLILQIVL